jgi:hypothetical protein
MLNENDESASASSALNKCERAHTVMADGALSMQALYFPSLYPLSMRIFTSNAIFMVLYVIFKHKVAILPIVEVQQNLTMH